jgi:Ni,Fe-hydrogenase III large subunit
MKTFSTNTFSDILKHAGEEITNALIEIFVENREIEWEKL